MQLRKNFRYRKIADIMKKQRLLLPVLFFPKAAISSRYHRAKGRSSDLLHLLRPSRCKNSGNEDTKGYKEAYSIG